MPAAAGGVSAFSVVAGCLGGSGEDTEHGCLIDSGGWVGAGIVAEADDGVAPGPRAEDVPCVRNCMAEGVALFDCAEGVAKGAAGPGRAGLEAGEDDGDCFAEDGFQGFDWGAVGAWR